MDAIQETIQPSLEYFAGHFDGEGCIYMRMRPESQRARLSITITAGFKPILDAYQRQFGGQVTKSTMSVNMQLWRWTLSSLPEVAKFLSTLLPFLWEKRGEAEIALTYLQVRLQYALRGGNGRGSKSEVSIMLDTLSQSTLHSLRSPSNVLLARP